MAKQTQELRIPDLKRAKEIRAKILEFMQKECELHYQEGTPQKPVRSLDGRMSLPILVYENRDIQALERFIETMIAPCDYNCLYDDKQEMYRIRIYYGIMK
jgi:hypothetical protein